MSLLRVHEKNNLFVLILFFLLLQPSVIKTKNKQADIDKSASKGISYSDQYVLAC